MNTLPSMDRHIQQTNDRLQCIKQVFAEIPISLPRPGAHLSGLCERWISDGKEQESSIFPFPLSRRRVQRLIWTSVFLAISTSHTDHVARGKERARTQEKREGGKSGSKHAKRLQRELDPPTTHPNTPFLTPVLAYTTFPTPGRTYAGPCCGFSSRLSRLPAFRRLSFTHIHTRTQIEINRQT